MKKVKKQILKSVLAIGVIAFAITITAVSCGKTAGGGGNNNANNSGSGGDNDPPLVATTNLVLTPLSSRPTWVKISGNTVTVNAAGLAGVVAALSDANDNNRGFDDAPASGAAQARANIFSIQYPGLASPAAGMYLVNRPSVLINNIAIPAPTTPCPSSESGDNALAAAAAGGACRIYTTVSGGTSINFFSHLGTAFNNTDATKARGSMRCASSLYKSNADTSIPVIDDTTPFNQSAFSTCSIAVVNSGGSVAEIDDTWVDDAASVKEVELYAIGIDVSDKTFEQFSGLKKADFDKALDNAAFKKMLRNNKWGELKFKVKIVKSSAF